MTFDLGALFVDHSDALHRNLTRQFGDAALASDLVQDTFVRLAQCPAPAPGGAGGIRNMRSYLGRIARNLALNHFRQVRQRRTAYIADDVLAGLPAEQPSAEAALDGQLRLARLRKAMAELPARTQQVFVLVRLSGRTYQAAAQELGISESSVQKHLARAVVHAMRHAD